MDNKKLRILIDIVLIILGIIFLVFGIKDAISMYNSTRIEDSVLFKKDFPYVSSDNIYEYMSIKELDKFVQKDTGIILIGNKNDSWTQVLVEPLNESVSYEYSKIYYYENDGSDKETKNYKNILSQLKIEKISNPTIVFVIDGKISNVYFKNDIYDGDYEGTPIDYWNEESKQNFSKNILNDIGKLK